MIGQTVTRKSDKVAFTIAAWDEAQSAYTLAPVVEFGPNIGVPADKLRADFSGLRNVSPPGATDEVTGWEKLSASFERAFGRQRQFDGVLTPEDVFAGRARGRAESIAADPDALAEYAVGLLPVSKEVAVVLDEVLEARAAEADKPRRRSKPSPDANTLSTEDTRRLGHK